MSEKENTSLTLRLPFWSIALLLMIIVDGISLAIDNFQIMGHTLHDYDTLTRLAYLREALQSHSLNQGFFDRINAPYGMVLHWTLPFNLLMLVLIKLFSAINPATALHYAGYWGGTVCRVFVGPAAYWTGRSFLKPPAAAVASLLVLFSPYLLAYGHRGSSNHHALMYLESVLLLGFAARLLIRRLSNFKLPLVTGIMAGLCLWTTFELVIVIGPLFVVLFYIWIVEGQPRLRQLVLATTGFAVTASCALLVNPPYGGLLAPELDHISLPLQSLASIPFLIALGALLLKPKHEVQRGLYVLCAGLVTGLAWLACYPFAIHGVQGTMDPYVQHEWLTQIEEVLPIENWRKVAAFLGIDFLAIVLVFVWNGPRAYKESVFGSMMFLYVIGQLHFRFALYGWIGAPYFIAYVFERARLGNGEFPATYVKRALPLTVALIACFVALQVSITIIHYDPLNPPDKDDVPDGVTCDPWLVRGPLNDAAWMGVGKKDPIVMSEVNQTAALLYWTGVKTVAGNYHRDSQGIKDDYQFFRSLDDKAAQEIVKKRGVDFVVLCGNGNNAAYSYENVDRAIEELSKPGTEFDPQPTLYTRLTDETPPAWLKPRPWPDDIDTDLLLYQVDRSKLGK